MQIKTHIHTSAAHLRSEQLVLNSQEPHSSYWFKSSKGESSDNSESINKDGERANSQHSTIQHIPDSLALASYVSYCVGRIKQDVYYVEVW